MTYNVYIDQAKLVIKIEDGNSDDYQNLISAIENVEIIRKTMLWKGMKYSSFNIPMEEAWDLVSSLEELSKESNNSQSIFVALSGKIRTALSSNVSSDIVSAPFYQHSALSNLPTQASVSNSSSITEER